MSNRRIFTEEFKAGAVQLVVSSGRSVKDVATELGIKEGTLGAWVRAWRAEHGGVPRVVDTPQCLRNDAAADRSPGSKDQLENR